jgi:hypothetical protein
MKTLNTAKQPNSQTAKVKNPKVVNLNSFLINVFPFY